MFGIDPVHKCLGHIIYGHFYMHDTYFGNAPKLVDAIPKTGFWLSVSIQVSCADSKLKCCMSVNSINIERTAACDQPFCTCRMFCVSSLQHWFMKNLQLGHVVLIGQHQHATLWQKHLKQLAADEGFARPRRPLNQCHAALQSMLCRLGIWGGIWGHISDLDVVQNVSYKT